MSWYSQVYSVGFSDLQCAVFTPLQKIHKPSHNTRSGNHFIYGGAGFCARETSEHFEHKPAKGLKAFHRQSNRLFHKTNSICVLQKNTSKSKISFSGHFVCFSWFNLCCVSQHRCGATLIKLWEMITLVFWYWGSTAPVETRRCRSCTQSRACCWQPGGSRIK